MSSVLDQLIGISPEELKILRLLNKLGAASADELAVKLDRAGEDIMPQIQHLLNSKLLQMKIVDSGEEKTELYLTARDVRPLL
jgi:predicted transcriptional regulator